MTHLHILGPPRTGRRVLTKEEFFEQVKNGALEPEVVEVQKKKKPRPNGRKSKKDMVVVGDDWLLPEDVLNGSLPVPNQTTVHPYFIAPGRFEVKDIQKNSDRYIFKGLKLPMGSWKELELHESFTYGLPEQELDVWVNVTRHCYPDGVMPVDIRYGLMAVCYLNQKRTDLQALIAEMKRKVWTPDVTKYPVHHATNIDYVLNSPAIITPGAGWGHRHPFEVQYQASITGLQSGIDKKSVLKDPTLGYALQMVFGENDPDRCKAVFAWAMGRPSPWMHRSQGMDRGVYGVGIQRADKDAIVSLTIDQTNRFRARFIHADLKHYSRQ